MPLPRPLLIFGLPAALVATAIVIIHVVQRRRTPPKGKLPPMAPYTQWEMLHHLSGPCSATFQFELGRKMGVPVYRMALPGFQTMYVLNDGELALKVFQEKENDKSARARLFDAMTGGLPSIVSLQTKDEQWQTCRKYIAPAFRVSILNKKVEVLEQKLEEFYDILDQHAAKDIPVDIDDLLLCLTLDFISLSAFDYNLRAMHDKHSEGRQFLNELDIILPEISRQFRNPFRRWMFWRPEIKRAQQSSQWFLKLALRILKAYRDAHSAEDIRADTSILAHLIRNTHYSSEEARAADVLILLFAGHDTTAHTLAWTFYELSRHPEIQQQLQDELDASAEGLANGSVQITQLSCLNRCLKESTRLWSVVAPGPVRVMGSDLEAHGMVIPKGSLVRPSFINIFRSTWLEDPDEFRPERWINPPSGLEEQLIPFGTGLRNCVGQNLANIELRAVLAGTLRRFSFELVEPPTPHFAITLKPKGLLLRVKRRTAAPQSL